MRTGHDLAAPGLIFCRLSLRLLLDYAFTIKRLERVYAEVFRFNQCSQRVLALVGMVREGVLRPHDIHNGIRQDKALFGILKPEFYQNSETIFQLPDT